MTSLTSFWCFYCKLWTYFTHFSNDSIVDFEQANVSCDVFILFPLQTEDSVWFSDESGGMKRENWSEIKLVLILWHRLRPLAVT